MEFLHRTWAQVSIQNIVENYRAIRRSCGTQVYAVVKADAYGHGAPAVAAALEKEGIDGFAVSNIEEAEELRQAGIQSELLILGYTPAECAKRLARGKITQCVFSREYAEALNSSAQKNGVTLSVQIKLDTGMGRIGFDCTTQELPGLDAVCAVFLLQNLRVTGAFTHYAVADSLSDADRRFTEEQSARFWKAVEMIEQRGWALPMKHCCNSAAAICSDEAKGSVVRAGIVLYGLAPSDELELPKAFKPAMALYSTVSMVKTVAPGAYISYGRTYRAPDSRVLATVSAGYADGVPRLLSNKGYVLIKGQKAPIVGRICMDQFCVDVTEIADVRMGDVVTIFGPGLPVEQVAAWAQTIHYEIICDIAKRVPRIYG